MKLHLEMDSIDTGRQRTIVRVARTLYKLRFSLQADHLDALFSRDISAPCQNEWHYRQPVPAAI